ncbi:hypothetical protein DF220_02830 [Salinibacterium hongtaonis]|uniref:AB hydrolase-1 domain-containing protein n=2 Tax=Homoserinimonas hongtaonis TaxID=2079791 RepID=A0A2U1SZ26_9MICO|nr:hypothetical protein DF220_02830 [Salinibacterium hongtaonis]
MCEHQSPTLATMSTFPRPAWFSPTAYDSATTHELMSSGARISYRTGGSGPGPRFLFVHGGRAHSTWWAAEVALFGANTPKWAAMDLSGHGDSEWRDNYPASVWLGELEAVASDLARDDSLILVGHSLGGMLSLLLGARGTVPRIEHIVSVDAVPLDPAYASAQAEPSTSKPFYPTIAEGAEAFSSRSARAGWPSWLAEFVGERSLRPRDGGWVWRHDNSSRTIERPVLTELGALDLSRVTLVSGSRSPYAASLNASGFVQMAGSALTHVRLETGHDVMMEKPAEFHRTLMDAVGR